MTAGDRHGFGRSRSGGRIVDDLTAASELARGAGVNLGAEQTGRLGLVGVEGGLSDSL